MIGGGNIGRRGMSPLIATVLLMAFAVALGAVIMNITIDHRAKGECESVKLNVLRFCQQGGAIRMTLENTRDSTIIHEVRLSYVEDNIENTLRLREVGLDPGKSVSDLDIKATIPVGSQVSVLTTVGENVSCTMPAATVELIPCS
jgi:flagellin-like protein